MIALAKAHELTQWIDAGLVILGCVEARQHGNHQQLNELYEGLPATRLESAVAWRRVVNLTLLAECLSEAGDVVKALTVLEAIPPEHRTLILGPEIRRLHGMLLLRRNERDHGERELREAIEMARRRSERILELRATMSLAQFLAEEGRRDEAHRALTAVHSWFTEGFGTADLKAARAMLGELS